MAEVLEEASALFVNGEFEEALAKFDEALEKIHPDQHYVIHSNKGAALMSLGNIEEAVSAFNQALEKNENHVESLHNKGVALSALENFEDAVECFNKAVLLSPEFVAAHCGKSEALASLEKYEEAAVAANDALKIEENSTVALADLAFAQLKLHKNGEACETYEKSLNAPNGDSAETKRLYSIALSQHALDLESEEGQLQTAIDKLIKSLSYHQTAAGYHNLGILTLRNEQNDEAIQNFTSAIKKDPLYFESHAALGALLIQQDKDEEAVVHLKKACSLDEEAIDPRFNLGLAYLKLKNIDQGKEEFKKVLAVEPEEPNSLAAIEILEQAQEKDKESETKENATLAASEIVKGNLSAKEIASKNAAEASESAKGAMDALNSITGGGKAAPNFVINKKNKPAEEKVSEIEEEEVKRTFVRDIGSAIPEPVKEEAATAKKDELKNIEDKLIQAQKEEVKEVSEKKNAEEAKPKTEKEEEEDVFLSAVARLDLDKKATTNRRKSVMEPPAKAELKKYEDYTTVKYSLEVLQKRDNKKVDPKKREQYLTDEEFESVLHMSRGEFDALPLWKRQRSKKKINLF